MFVGEVPECLQTEAAADGATVFFAARRREVTIEVMVRTRAWLEGQGVVTDRLRGTVFACRALLAGGFLEGTPPEAYTCIKTAEEEGSNEVDLTVRPVRTTPAT